ncbi:MAG TPA: PilZ domain-containing protein [Blastocatellia bacterium]
MSNSGDLIHTSQPLNTGKLISAYYLEIDYLLDRVEGATNHYQTLGVERSASNEEIIGAYQNAVTVLHPSYYKVRAAVPDEMLVRVDKAFKRVSEAFSVMTDTKKRTAYERSLARLHNIKPLEIPNPPQPKRPEAKQPKHNRANDKSAVNAEASEIKVFPEAHSIFTKTSTLGADADRRRCERFKLTVPALVAGYDQQGDKWQEIAKTIDVSRIGVAIKMRRRVRHGLIVHVTLPLPTKLRSHGFSDPGYNMYAIVRRVEPLIDDLRVVGLEFIGASPPADYLQKPWATFRTQKWNGPDRRREPRRELAEPVAVEYLDELRQRIAREAAVTENVSSGGARVRVKSAPTEFEFVRIASPNRGFNSLALVRNRWTGSDGFERLCLKFVDQTWPV